MHTPSENPTSIEEKLALLEKELFRMRLRRQSLDKYEQKIQTAYGELKNKADELVRKDDEIRHGQADLAHKAKQLAEIERQLKINANRIETEKQKLYGSYDELAKMRRGFDQQQSIMDQQESSLQAELLSFQESKERLEESKSQLATQQRELQDQQSTLEQLGRALEERQQTLSENEEALQDKEAKLKVQQSRLKTREHNCDSRERALGKQTSELDRRERDIVKETFRISKSKVELDNEFEKLEKYRRELDEKESRLLKKERNFEHGLDLHDEIERKNEQIRLLERQIEEFKAALRELSEDRAPATEKPAVKLPPGDDAGSKQGESKDSLSIRPQVLCRKDGWEWQIGVEIPPEVDCLAITQDNNGLEESHNNPGFFLLNSIRSPVQLSWQDGGYSIPLAQSADFLIFKMRKDWQGPGRLVKSTSSGFYVVVVPADWRRNEEVNGPEPFLHEDVSLDGFRVHFFYLSRGWSEVIKFICETDSSVTVDSRNPRFRLVGNEIRDNSDELGPLFGSQLPSLEQLDDRGWEDVAVIEVGDESTGSTLCRKCCTVEEANDSSELPEEMSEIEAGQYCVRLYDKNGELLDALDFRYIKALKKIKVLEYTPLPNPQNGHQPISIIFHHQEGCEIRSASSNDASLSLTGKSNKTTAILPPMPAWDQSEWIVAWKGTKIPVELVVDRVWWHIEDDKQASQSADGFSDKALQCEDKWFNATSSVDLTIWLSRMGWLNHLWLGTDYSTRRKYRVKKAERHVRIALRGFDSTDFLDKEGLKLWISATEPENCITVISNKEIGQEKAGEPHPPELQPMRCCSTCDHARRRLGSFWCRRYHWPPVVEWLFQQDFANHHCPEWRGEVDFGDNRSTNSNGEQK